VARRRGRDGRPDPSAVGPAARRLRALQKRRGGSGRRREPTRGLPDDVTVPTTRCFIPMRYRTSWRAVRRRSGVRMTPACFPSRACDRSRIACSSSISSSVSNIDLLRPRGAVFEGGVDPSVFVDDSLADQVRPTVQEAVPGTRRPDELGRPSALSVPSAAQAATLGIDRDRRPNGGPLREQDEDRHGNRGPRHGRHGSGARTGHDLCESSGSTRARGVAVKRGGLGRHPRVPPPSPAASFSSWRSEPRR
jgi:hypothetical protein